MNIRCHVGAEMARLRKARGLTQAELAAIMGVSQRMIAACEVGERRPSAELAQRIGAELGFPWTMFFEEPRKSDNVDAFEEGAG